MAMSLADSHLFSTWSRCDDEKPRPCSSGCAFARARGPVTMGSRPQMSLHAPITSRTVVGPWGLGGREVHTFLAGRAQSGGGWMRVAMSEDPPSKFEVLLWVVDARRGVPLELRCPAKRRMSPARGGTVRRCKRGSLPPSGSSACCFMHVDLRSRPESERNQPRKGGAQGVTAAPCMFR